MAEKLGLKPEPISTQVIPRDRHAAYFAALAVVASSIERLATEIRHLQRTELLEAEEHFTAGQKGSSAMPHKRNPVLSENLTGLARLVRAYAFPALEDVALWHERDISHSSVERVIGPDATIALDFALNRMTAIIKGLVVYPERMRANLDRLGGLIHSQRVLLALTEAGVSREEAYRLVQRNAMKVWETGGDFLDQLLADKDVARALPEKTLRAQFDLGYHTKHVDTIFERVFGKTRVKRAEAVPVAARSLAVALRPVPGIAVIVAAPTAEIGIDAAAAGVPRIPAGHRLVAGAVGWDACPGQLARHCRRRTKADERDAEGSGNKSFSHQANAYTILSSSEVEASKPLLERKTRLRDGSSATRGYW